MDIKVTFIAIVLAICVYHAAGKLTRFNFISYMVLVSMYIYSKTVYMIMMFHPQR